MEILSLRLKVYVGVDGSVKGAGSYVAKSLCGRAGGYVNKPKIGYSSGLNWTFLTFT